MVRSLQRPRHRSAHRIRRQRAAVVAIVVRALQHHYQLLVPAGVVAQAWRDGARQTRRARLLGSFVCQVLALDDRHARAAGQLCGLADTADVIDAPWRSLRANETHGC